MIASDELNDFINRLVELKLLIQEVNARTVQPNPDEIFSGNVNLFVRSFFVSACSTLEAYIQTVANLCASRVSAVLQDNPIPRNVVLWELGLEAKKNLKSYSQFEISKGKKEIEEMVSGNYYKTKIAFENLGVDVSSDQEFRDFADSISTRIDKRNQIVHHDDDASDVSFQDVIDAIDEFISYMKCIQRVVSSTSVFGSSASAENVPPPSLHNLPP